MCPAILEMLSNNISDSNESKSTDSTENQDDLNISQSLLEEVMTELVDEVALGLCFDIHRACKRGFLFLDETDEETQRQYEIVDIRGLDVFGQVPNSVRKNMDCMCPNCQRTLAASRFAPHLEKCMGMGRTSSRVASRRIAKGKEDEASEPDEQDAAQRGEDRDKDWSYEAKRNKKIRRDKHAGAPRHHRGRRKHGPFGHYITQSHLPPAAAARITPMSEERRRAFLQHSCSVVSDQTGKICTRSHRCPHHTDEQRRKLRLTLGARAGGAEHEDTRADPRTPQGGDDLGHWQVTSTAAAEGSNNARVPLRATIKLTKTGPGHKYKTKKGRPQHPTVTSHSLGLPESGRVTPPPFGHEYSKGK